MQLKHARDSPERSLHHHHFGETKLHNPRCEREAAAVAVAEVLNKQVITVDPKAIRRL